MITNASVILLAILSVSQTPAGEPTIAQLRKQLDELAAKVGTKRPELLAKRIVLSRLELQDLDKQLADAQATLKKLQCQQASDAAILKARDAAILKAQLIERTLVKLREQRQQSVEQAEKDLAELKDLQAKLEKKQAENLRYERFREWLRERVGGNGNIRDSLWRFLWQTVWQTRTFRIGGNADIKDSLWRFLCFLPTII
jgi:hypothetical protein